jgi:MFS family permease
MMSPSLTEIANDLGFTERSRDLYIGSYMQLCYAVVSLPFSLIGGILTDHVNRIILLAVVVVFGGLSMIGFGLFQSYEILLFLRLVQGIAFGAVVPIIYSLMSDLFHPYQRARMSAYMTVYLGAGTLFGQLFAGYMAPLVGWHFPFIFFGSITLLEGVLILQILKEPTRGGMDRDPNDADDQEQGLHDDPAASSLLPSSHGSSSDPTSSTAATGAPPLFSKATLHSSLQMFLIPSVFLMFVQTIPNK